MNKFLGVFAGLPTKMVGILAISIAGIYYFALYDDGASIDQSIQTAKASLQEAETKIKKIEQAVADLAKYEKEFKVMTDQYQKALEYMPNEPDISLLMQVISTEARASGVSIQGIGESSGQAQYRSGSGDQEEFYKPMSIDIELQGSFSEILVFLSNISKVKRLIRTQKIEIQRENADPSKPDANSKQLKFKATLVGYSYKEDTAKDVDESGQPRQ